MDSISVVYGRTLCNQHRDGVPSEHVLTFWRYVYASCKAKPSEQAARSESVQSPDSDREGHQHRASPDARRLPALSRVSSV